MEDTLSQEVEALTLLSEKLALDKIIEEQNQELKNKEEKIAKLKEKHGVKT